MWNDIALGRNTATATGFVYPAFSCKPSFSSSILPLFAVFKVHRSVCSLCVCMSMTEVSLSPLSYQGSRPATRKRSCPANKNRGYSAVALPASCNAFCPSSRSATCLCTKRPTVPVSVTSVLCSVDDLHLSNVAARHIYTIRPYLASDEAAVYDVCIKTVKEPLEAAAAKLSPTLVADHLIGDLICLSYEVRRGTRFRSQP